LINLEELNLGNNRIKTIDSQAFKNLKKLKDINLSNNELEYINILESLEKINIINISCNPINNIDIQIFNNLKFLEKIYIINNNINNLENLRFQLPHISFINTKIIRDTFNSNYIYGIDLYKFHEDKIISNITTGDTYGAAAASIWC